MKLWLKKNNTWVFFKNVKKEDLESRNIFLHPSAGIDESTMLGQSVTIREYATVRGVMVGDGVMVGADSIIGSRSTIGEKSMVGERTIIGPGSLIGLGAKIEAHVIVGGGTIIGAYSKLRGFSRVGEGSLIGSRSLIGKRVKIGARAKIDDGVIIKNTSDCVVLGPIGSRNAILTGYFYDGDVWIGTGCFSGRIKTFKKAVKKKHAGTIHEADYLAACTYIRKRISLAQKRSKS